ncbi:MAG: SpoIIE family protein phosphatase [Thermoanaerobaculaceae bacterium]|nr:SpoIIE family protein phosphatase [Thermoanaerobaculaceae bacterium]TAM44819.1 MAG: FHA domain-containing protein [Acidobacteriota bacterium]
MTTKESSEWSHAPTLVPRDPGAAAARVRVRQAALRIGRDPACDVVVAEPTVSRRHAQASWDGRELVIEDLGSSGGTFVNGARVQRAVVHPGDVVRLGPRIEYLAQEEETTSALEIAAEQSGDNEGGVRHLQTLLEVARALNAATVLEDVVHVVLQAAVRMLRADRGCVILIENGQRRTVACHPRDLSETSWAAHSSLFDRALSGRRVVHAGAELSPSTTMVARGAALAVAAPLMVARRPIGPAKDASFVASVEVIGGIMVERAKAGQRFGSEDLAVLESLAADAAVAIDSARLYREARDKAKIDHEMGLARAIQAALLRPPPQVPFADVFAFSQSARIVGGDLYNAAVREDGALAVALGDVSGKGVPAALIMAMVQGLLGLLHELGQPIAAVLPALNRSLIEHNPGNRFLTLGAGVLAADGTLELANAGHCPLAVLRADGTVQLVPPKGPILGLLPDAVWGIETLRLDPGESVVFYSDGVSESFAPNDVEFGVEGVQRTLGGLAGAGAEEVAQALLQAAATHRAGREAEDDVTLLVVRYTGQG